uniref:Uncharacterized protein LOC113788772 n=1 Tax=Dermatophagoides pteronyssinus TaxID=6956 RepID=A0A6P6XMM9_DERPT|nr:uncharacterized protein LOC113788772 [Dermatophagoides pteronyssinus]
MASARNGGGHHGHRHHHHRQYHRDQCDGQLNTKRFEILFQSIRFILIILLVIIFIISTIYFIRAIDAIGDDIDRAGETHFGHEIEENIPDDDNLLVSRKNSRFDPYKDSEDDHYRNEKTGRLIKNNGHNHFYRITNSNEKHYHIISLIIWVVLTLFCSILSLVGILGAIFLNPCMVLFSAIMILVHTICSHILPIFQITFPNLTSNWFLLALEVPTISFAILFVLIFRIRQKRIVNDWKQRRILY